MAKVVGVHRLALKPGVKGSDFEKFMQKTVFPGLTIVIQVDKKISHDFTLADWGRAEHLLLRSNQDDEDAETDSIVSQHRLATASPTPSITGFRPVRPENMRRMNAFATAPDIPA